MRFSEKAQALADSKGAALSYGDFNGLTQVEYGFDGVQTSPFDPGFPIPPGDPSLPDPQYPGPAFAYADAIHLTPEAFLLLAENQYEAVLPGGYEFPDQRRDERRLVQPRHQWAGHVDRGFPGDQADVPGLVYLSTRNARPETSLHSWENPGIAG